MELSPLKRKAILTAAQKEFLTCGYKNANMTAIAQLADVSKRTLYKHFPSKEILFSVILETLAAEAYSKFSYSYSSDRPLQEQLNELLKARLKVITSKTYLGFFKVSLPDVINSAEEATKLYNRLMDSPITEWFEAAYVDKRFSKKESEHIRTQLLSLTDMHCFWSPVLFSRPLPSKKEREEWVEETVEMVLDYHSIR